MDSSSGCATTCQAGWPSKKQGGELEHQQDDGTYCCQLTAVPGAARSDTAHTCLHVSGNGQAGSAHQQRRAVGVFLPTAVHSTVY